MKLDCVCLIYCTSSTSVDIISTPPIHCDYYTMQFNFGSCEIYIPSGLFRRLLWFIRIADPHTIINLCLTSRAMKKAVCDNTLTIVLPCHLYDVLKYGSNYIAITRWVKNKCKLKYNSTHLRPTRNIKCKVCRYIEDELHNRFRYVLLLSCRYATSRAMVKYISKWMYFHKATGHLEYMFVGVCLNGDIELCKYFHKKLKVKYNINKLIITLLESGTIQSAELLKDIVRYNYKRNRHSLDWFYLYLKMLERFCKRNIEGDNLLLLKAYTEAHANINPTLYRHPFVIACRQACDEIHDYSLVELINSRRMNRLIWEEAFLNACLSGNLEYIRAELWYKIKVPVVIDWGINNAIQEGHQHVADWLRGMRM